MDLKPLHITFGREQLVVRSHSTEVLASAKARFRYMPPAEGGRTLARLDVRGDGQSYTLTIHGDETRVERGSLDYILRRLDYEVVLQFVDARPDLLWFHAGAAADRERAVVFLGAWGQGKSTLVTHLYRRGWTYLSDDVVPLDPGSGSVLPFPLAPAVRPDQGQEIPVYRLRRLEKEQVVLDPERVCRTPLPLGGVVFPQYTPGGPTRLEPCSPALATVQMLQECANANRHRASAARFLSHLLAQRPVVRLFFTDGEAGADAIDELLE